MNDSIIHEIAQGDVFAAWDAAGRYRKVPHAEDLPRLIAAYETRTTEPKVAGVGMRMEIIDLISLVGTSEACDFLRKVAHSRTSYLVRYDAMRGLIELGDQDWQPSPDSTKKRGSDFYASLLAYEKYRRGEIDFDALRSLALGKTNGRGDFWHWITNLEPRRIDMYPVEERGEEQLDND